MHECPDSLTDLIDVLKTRSKCPEFLIAEADTLLEVMTAHLILRRLCAMCSKSQSAIPSHSRQCP